MAGWGQGEALCSWNCGFRGFSALCWDCLWGADGVRGRSQALCWAPGNQPVVQGKQEEDAVVEKLNLFLDLLQSYKVSLGCTCVFACACVYVSLCVCMCISLCLHVCACLCVCFCVCLCVCV